MTGQDWLTVDAAAARLGLSPNAVRGRIKRGTLRAIRRNSRVFVVLPRGAAGATNRSAHRPTNHPTNRGANLAASPVADSSPDPTLERLGRLAEGRKRQVAALRDERDRLARQVDRQQRLLEREQGLRARLQDQLDRLSQGLAAALPEAASGDPAETADRLWRRLEHQVRRLNEGDADKP